MNVGRRKRGKAGVLEDSLSGMGLKAESRVSQILSSGSPPPPPLSRRWRPNMPRPRAGPQPLPPRQQGLGRRCHRFLSVAIRNTETRSRRHVPGARLHFRWHPNHPSILSGSLLSPSGHRPSPKQGIDQSKQGIREGASPLKPIKEQSRASVVAIGHWFPPPFRLSACWGEVGSVVSLGRPLGAE